MKRRDAGTTLLEVLCYCALLSTLMSMCLSVFVYASRLNVSGRDALDRLNATRRFEQEFRSVVREAKGVRATFQGYRSDANTLILESPSDPETGATRRYVVIGNFQAENAPKRLTMAYFAQNDEKATLLKTESAPFSVKEILVRYDAEDVEQARRFDLRYRIAHEGRAQRTEPQREVSVALRNGGPT